MIGVLDSLFKADRGDMPNINSRAKQEDKNMQTDFRGIYEKLMEPKDVDKRDDIATSEDIECEECPDEDHVEREREDTMESPEYLYYLPLDSTSNNIAIVNSLESEIENSTDDIGYGDYLSAPVEDIDALELLEMEVPAPRYDDSEPNPIGEPLVFFDEAKSEGERPEYDLKRELEGGEAHGQVKVERPMNLTIDEMKEIIDPADTIEESKSVEEVEDALHTSAVVNKSTLLEDKPTELENIHGEETLLKHDRKVPEAEDQYSERFPLLNDFQDVARDTPIISDGEDSMIIDYQENMDIVERLSTNIFTSIREDRSEMVVHLRPEYLGKVVLRVSLDSDIVSARIFTDSHETRDIISTQLEELEYALDEKGYRIGNLDVDIDQNGSQSHSFFHQEQNSYKRGTDKVADIHLFDREPTIPNTMAPKIGSGNIDYFA